MKKFEQLPQEVQEKIKSKLTAYDEVTVTYEYGEYRFGTVIKATYGDDHEVIGTFYAKDIFTEEERILNYVNNFQSYPTEYKGERDYRIFNTGKREEFTYDENGNIVIK